MLSVIVLISANVEWQAVKRILRDRRLEKSPYGEWFTHQIFTEDVQNKAVEVKFFQGGWGKVSAAGSTQYAIDLWQPDLLINFGTCGGFKGRIEKGQIFLVEKAIIYDIIEQMYPQEDHIAQYTTELDLSWLDDDYPIPVLPEKILSADRDLIADEIPELIERYDAVACDWESGAIAYIASKNKIPLLILRGVSDLISENAGEAYDDPGIFEENAIAILQKLILTLPDWLTKCRIPSARK